MDYYLNFVENIHREIFFFSIFLFFIFSFFRILKLFYFRTQIESVDQHGNWVMNTCPECLETRMEVQFFDKYDLMGQGNQKAIDMEKGTLI